MDQTPASLATLARLVDHMFDQVLNEAERAELLVWIHAWEEANPEVDAAHRVTGWIDVAYAFQARADRAIESRTAVTISRWDLGGLGLAAQAG